MVDNAYLDFMRRERDQCASMLASLDSGKLLSGVSPKLHEARVNFMRRQIADLTTAIAAEEALDA